MPQILEPDITDMRGTPRRFSRQLSPTFVRPTDSPCVYRRRVGHNPQIIEAAIAHSATPQIIEAANADNATPQIFEATIASTKGAVRKVARVSFSSNMRLAELSF